MSENNNKIKTYSCPKCGTEIEMDAEVLDACGGMMVCPNCQASLQVSGDYAYVPLEGQDFTAEEATSDTQQTGQVPTPSTGFDPLEKDAVEYLKTLNAISVPQLARYFNTTLDRAQLLMQNLEKKGIVGPYNGGAPRTILIDHNPGLPSPFGHSRTLEKDQEQRTILEQIERLSKEQNGQAPKVHTFGCNIFSVFMFLLILYLIFRMFR